MFNVIKTVISTKNYELNNILTKIDTLWVQGVLSDAQRTSLIEMAQANAKTENSIDVITKLVEVERRVTLLESKVANLGTSDTNTDTDTETDTEESVAEFVEGKWYYAGDKVTYNGATYTCIAPEGVVCVWNPDAYAAYWQIEN